MNDYNATELCDYVWRNIQDFFSSDERYCNWCFSDIHVGIDAGLREGPDLFGMIFRIWAARRRLSAVLRFTGRKRFQDVACLMG